MRASDRVPRFVSRGMVLASVVIVAPQDRRIYMCPDNDSEYGPRAPALISAGSGADRSNVHPLASRASDPNEESDGDTAGASQDREARFLGSLAEFEIGRASCRERV